MDVVDELEDEVSRTPLAHASADEKKALSDSDLVVAIRADVDEFLRSGTDPLAELDKSVRGATEYFYREFAPGIVARLADVRTSVRHSGPPVSGSLLPAPEGSTPPWLVAGRTSFPHTGGPAFAVYLDFGGPDWRTWAAAPYVLMHELANHAAQGPWSEMCDPPEDTDQFAEGWMELVALILTVLLAEDALGRHVPSLADGSDHAAAAAGLYDERRSKHEFSSRRRQGIEVAERFRRFLWRRSPLRDDLTFLRCSLQVNASDATQADRLRFVGGIKLALNTAQRGESLPGDQTLDDWVDEYEQGGDIKLLLRRAIDLSRRHHSIQGARER